MSGVLQHANSGAYGPFQPYSPDRPRSSHQRGGTAPPQDCRLSADSLTRLTSTHPFNVGRIYYVRYP